MQPYPNASWLKEISWSRSDIQQGFPVDFGDVRDNSAFFDADLQLRF